MSDVPPVGYYEWLDFNNPMTERTASDLVTELAATCPRRVLDIGCGWAELLLRLIDACPSASGHGIDHDDALIDRAQRNASTRGLTPRVTFADSIHPDDDGDLVINVGAEHVFGDLEQALAELTALVRPGGRLFLGTQFWEQPPSSDLVDALGELPTLSGLIDLATSTGLRPLALRVASPDDWDHFEFGFLKDWEQHVMAASSIESARKAAKAADEHRHAYMLRRGVLGFAFLTLGKPAHPFDTAEAG